MRSFLFTAAAASLALPAWADSPKVVTDIAPVHSLVAQVMQGVGAPTMLVDPGASPHGYALRPSQAKALSEADVVVWVGERLTPWLEHPLENLAPNAASVELLELESTIKLNFREGASFEDHDHDVDDAHADEHHDDHDDHDDHADEHHEGHDDHDDHADAHDDHDDHEQDEHAGHDHEGVDPHAWLDPVNAQRWMQDIAEQLGRMDPENADTYARNAAEGGAALDDLIAEMSADLAPAEPLKFVVFHDAYHYFEYRFGLTATAAISLGDASDPSAGRVAEVREAVHDAGVTCVFSEPQMNEGLIRAVADGGMSVAQIDPLGVGLTPGPSLYPQMLRKVSDSILTCLK